MRPFKYVRADRPGGRRARRRRQTRRPSSSAGGTNLLDLMKEDVERPTRTRRPHAARPGGDQATTAAACRSARSRRTPTPPITRSIRAALPAAHAGDPRRRLGAAPQHGDQRRQPAAAHALPVLLRHRACRATSASPAPAAARCEGLNRMHAILGWSEQCVATYPGDMANALVRARCRGARARRGRDASARSRFDDFHRLPGDTPQRDNNLAARRADRGDRAAGVDRSRSTRYYLKVRDRASLRVRARLRRRRAGDCDGDTIKQARVVLGGVAHKPWRSREAEAALVGKAGDGGDLPARGRRRAGRGASRWSTTPTRSSWAKRAIVRALMRAQAGGA